MLNRSTPDLGRVVHAMGVTAIQAGRGIPVTAAAVAERRGWTNIASHMKAATGAIGEAGGFVLPQGIAETFIGSLPRNSLSAALDEATRDYGLVNRIVILDNESLVAEEVGESLAIPVAGLAASSIQIQPHKCAIIIPYSEELIVSSNCAAVVESDTRLALARGLDAAILSRLVPGSAGGIDATSDPWADVRKLFSALALTGQLSPILCASVDTAILMATLRSNGQAAFGEMSPGGGHCGGAPVVVSDRLASESLLAVDPQSIALTIGAVEVALSRNTSLQMDTAPGQDASQGTGSTMTSMFQTFSIALKVTVDFSITLLRGERVSETLQSIGWANS